jgi:hypothetical protein
MTLQSLHQQPTFHISVTWLTVTVASFRSNESNAATLSGILSFTAFFQPPTFPAYPVPP